MDPAMSTWLQQHDKRNGLEGENKLALLRYHTDVNNQSNKKQSYSAILSQGWGKRFLSYTAIVELNTVKFIAGFLMQRCIQL